MSTTIYTNKVAIKILANDVERGKIWRKRNKDNGEAKYWKMYSSARELIWYAIFEIEKEKKEKWRSGLEKAIKDRDRKTQKETK